MAINSGAESGSIGWREGEVRAWNEGLWGEEEVAAGAEYVEGMDAHFVSWGLRCCVIALNDVRINGDRVLVQRFWADDERENG